VDLDEIEREMARLEAAYRPVATRRIELDELRDPATLGARIQADLARLGVEERAQAVLRATIAAYAGGDEPVRAAIRRLFDRHPSFRWAANLPPGDLTAEAVRSQLIHLSARDQGGDTRDEILALRDLCRRARQAGVDVDPILDEVAAMSSDEDRYGMGSTRRVILAYGRPAPG
jgi:hypothetical protein